MKYMIPALVLATPLHAQSASDIQFAKEILAEIQDSSIDRNREFCGYIGVTPDGTIEATQPDRGRKSSCRARNVPEDWDLTYSYHSHGGFSFWADSEVPSSTDIEGDHDEGVDGWVVTPGGRMWFIDGQAQTAKLICGEGCLEQHPDYEPDPEAPVRAFYTLDDIKAREAGDAN